MDGFRVNEIDDFISRIGIKINDRKLLDRAFHHSSFAYENSLKEDNERLEFLGDAVLGMIISDELYKYHPDMPEGALSKIRSSLVSRKALISKSKLLGLDDLLRLGKGEELTGGRQRTSILAGVFEAVLGAIYLDAGIDAARRFVIEYVIEADRNAFEGNQVCDFKSDLQEVVQREYQTIPEYKIVDERGPDHQKEFKAHVYINEELAGAGAGPSKKAAEFAAAENAFEKLESDDGNEGS